MSANLPVALVPRDGFFCKDGRDWLTSESGRGHGMAWPWPSTVLGALRTGWGRGLEEREGRPLGKDDWRSRTAGIVLGRSLALRRPPGVPWSRDQRVWPVPSDALWLEGGTNVHRLDPRPPLLPTLGRDDDDAREALWVSTAGDAAKPRLAPLWWSERCHAAWLAGHPEATDSADEQEQFTPVRRVQTHVGISSMELTAKESVLFAHDVVETLEPCAEWAVGVEVDLPDGEMPTLVRLGSDGRLARVEPLPAAMFEPPTAMLDAIRAGSAGLRLVVVTPACFERGWLPDGLEPRGGVFRGRLPLLDIELVLRAAMVPRPVHVSGWDMAAGRPKPVSRMVAPGAVYFFERVDGRPFDDDEARALWLVAVGARTEEGYGRLVPGAWHPKRS